MTWPLPYPTSLRSPGCLSKLGSTIRYSKSVQISYRDPNGSHRTVHVFMTGQQGPDLYFLRARLDLNGIHCIQLPLYTQDQRNISCSCTPRDPCVRTDLPVVGWIQFHYLGIQYKVPYLPLVFSTCTTFTRFRCRVVHSWINLLRVTRISEIISLSGCRSTLFPRFHQDLTSISILTCQFQYQDWFSFPF